MAEPDLDAAEKDMDEAVSSVLTKHGLMANRWLLAAEVLEEDGERSLLAMTSPDLRSWDSLGMLGYLIERERAAIHEDYRADPD